MRHIIILALLVAGLRAATVESTTFAMPIGLRLDDGVSQAVIVPAFARLASFARSGGPNLLFENRQAVRCMASWYNLGGDRVWPWPQASWRTVTGRAWPPPLGCDGPLTAETTAEGVVVLRGMIPAYGLRLVREFRLAAGVLRTTSRLERINPAIDPGPVAVWQITQVPFAAIVADCPDAAAVAARAAPWQAVAAGANRLDLTIDGERGGELVLSATALAWRGTDGAGLAIRRIGPGGPAKIWAGRGSRLGAQAEDASAELEFTSPERPLAVGESVELVTELVVLAADALFPEAGR